MTLPIVHLALSTERDVVQARQRAREIAAELGLDNQEQIRFATATSEMARNAFRYARNGKIEFALELEEPQQLKVTVSDSGPGIPNLDEILEGRYRSETGLGMGIIGTRRLMDEFQINATPTGTTVVMTKRLPRHRATWTAGSASDRAKTWQRCMTRRPLEEIEQQTQELQ